MASAKKKSIYIIGNSHTKMFLGNDTLDFPENATSESDVFKYIIFNVGPSTAYNFFWNPKYYPTLINRLNNNTIEFDYISLLLGEIDCREHVINQYIANKKSMEDNIVEIIDRYMMCVIDLKKRGYKPIVFAVHPPTTALITKGTAKEIIPIIITIMILYNEILKERCRIHSIFFCDLFSELLISLYVANDDFYIDDIHLKGTIVRDMYEKKLAKLILNESNQ